MNPMTAQPEKESPMNARLTRRRVTSTARRLSVATLAVATVAGLAGGGASSVAVGQEPGVGPTPADASASALDEATLDERVTVAGAARRAKALGQPVEALSLRTDRSSVFVHPSGRRSAKLYAGPVRVKKRGHWRPLDTSLTRAGGEVRPRTTEAEMTFSGGADRSLASVEGERGSLDLSWKGDRLPAPVLAGQKALYRDVEPGVDIALSAAPKGFTQRIVVDRVPKEPLVLRFGLKLSGLRARLTEHDRVELIDRRGKRVALANPARMWGSQIGRRSHEPLKQATVATRLVEAGEEQVLELRPDPAFMASVKGPVTIEPGAADQPAFAYADLMTNGDTYVSSDWPSATYGGSTELKSGSYNGRNLHRSLVRFPGRADSAGNGLSGIPRGAHVTSAAMHLYNHWSWSCRPRTTEVYRVSRAWGVNSASWAKQPVVGARYGSASHANGYSSACPADYVGFSITDLAQKWVDQSVPNYGVRVQPKDEARRDTFSWRKFRSANYASGAKAPFLLVEYTPPTS